MKNEKPGFAEHTEFFLMSTDSKKIFFKKSAHTTSGIFKENTFFSSTNTDKLWNSREVQ